MNLLPRDGDVRLHADWLARERADAFFSKLRSGLPWEQPMLRIFGREIAAPRLESWHGDPGAAYEYSGLAHAPLGWTPELASLRDTIEQASGWQFNSVLANLYRDGNDSNGWHADDEPELGDEPKIASLSLGATRRFLLRHRASGQSVELALAHGSLLLMSGRTQQCWKHTIPKERRVREPRVNLTFRYIFSR